MKRIPASTVQELGIDELKELVRQRIGDAIEDIPDEEIIGKGKKYYLELFATFIFYFLFYGWLFFCK